MDDTTQIGAGERSALELSPAARQLLAWAAENGGRIDKVITRMGEVLVTGPHVCVDIKEPEQKLEQWLQELVACFARGVIHNPMVREWLVHFSNGKNAKIGRMG